MTLWRAGREELVPALLIILLPLGVALPQLLGWLHSDPLLYAGAMTGELAHGFLGGFPAIDPNSAYTTQALGYRAALDWLQGIVPWWNPYSGVGLPLAAEYQPAVFFPLTLLLLLPHGMAWQHVVLQALAGLGTYGLLRQLGLVRLAATAGGLLFAFDGTLAWFSHAAAQPVAFLPWMLLGIERARVKAALGLPRGWRLLGLAMALSLLAGFPETAYLDGLLALAWALLRGFQRPSSQRVSYAARIAAGGVVGLALAAPQILAFLAFLPHAFVGSHGAELAHAALPPHAAIPSLVAPYVYGPIFAYPNQWPTASFVWGTIGGYVSVLILGLAAYGVAARRCALAWMLLAWSVLALARSFGLEPALSLWNLVPGVSLTAFFRYAQPTWELALIVLAAFALDELARTGRMRRAAWLVAAAVLAVAWVAALAYGIYLWPELKGHVGLRNPALASALWATCTAIACLWLIARAASPRALRALAVLVVAEAIFFFAIPTLSSPRGGRVDMPAIAFLRENLGLQRFYTLGPIAPNYGAYFGIASINHNYLPVATRWANWFRAHLDPGNDNPVVFNGVRFPSDTNAMLQLRAHLADYEWVGVKYVVASGEDNPFEYAQASAREKAAKKVYRDAVMSIYELADPRPYFEAVAGGCTVEARERVRVLVSCANPTKLVRRELFFPGWSATVNGAPAPIEEHEALFQAIALPQGRSDVRYSYELAGAGWAWLATLLALLALCIPPHRRDPATDRSGSQA